MSDVVLAKTLIVILQVLLDLSLGRSPPLPQEVLLQAFKQIEELERRARGEGG